MIPNDRNLTTTFSYNTCLCKLLPILSFSTLLSFMLPRAKSVEVTGDLTNRSKNSMRDQSETHPLPLPAHWNLHLSRDRRVPSPINERRGDRGLCNWLQTRLPATIAPECPLLILFMRPDLSCHPQRRDPFV